MFRRSGHRFADKNMRQAKICRHFRSEMAVVPTARRTTMAVQHNTDHIQTTHIGSLPRPHDLLDLLKAKYAGQACDERQLNSVLAQAVAECVRRQVECGIEIVTDGEYSKPGFFTY